MTGLSVGYMDEEKPVAKVYVCQVLTGIIMHSSGKSKSAAMCSRELGHFFD